MFNLNTLKETKKTKATNLSQISKNTQSKILALLLEKKNGHIL